MSMARASDLGPERPFPGLRPYGFDDARWFCGRELQTSALYTLVERNRFSAVVGSSGSGKSSLVRAGLLPVLAAETVERGGKQWRCFDVRPGDAPMARLADALAGPVPGADADPLEHAVRAGLRDSLEFNLRHSSFGIQEALRELRLPEGWTVLLLVDQFEEIFRFADLGRAVGDGPADLSARHEAAAFVELLLQAARSSDHAVHIVLTMRSDYLGECARFQGLPEAVTQSQFLVPAMTRDQREQAICDPIERAGATVEHELVERLLNDGSDELDQLPVLQHALMRTWEYAGHRLAREGERPGRARELLLTDYKAIGSLAHALTIHADEVMADLPGLDTAVEQVFRALAELDREGRAVRRARRFVTLFAETGCEEGHLRTVIDRFRRLDCSFLVPPPPTEIENDTVVDIGHEALIRRWKRMSAAPEAAFAGAAGNHHRAGWLWAEAADGNAYRTLLELIRGAPVGVNPTLPVDQITKRLRWWNERPRTAAWAERYGGDFDAVEKLFVDSLAKLKRAERNRTLTRSALTAALVVSLGFGGFAAYQWRSADEQRQVAETEKKRAEEQTKIAEQQTKVAEQQAIEAKASSFWARLQLLPDTLRPEDVKALWDLAASPEEVRAAFIHQMTEEPNLMRQFGMNPQAIARAVGLDWPKAASDQILSRIQTAVSTPPDTTDNGIWQTIGTIRAIIALTDLLDPATKEKARQYVARAVRASAERAVADPTRLWMVAQIGGSKTKYLDSDTIDVLREKVAAAIDAALSSPTGKATPGLAFGIGLGASLPPFSPSRTWAAFDYLIEFVMKQPNSGFGGGARAARQIGPLVARLQPLGRAQMRGRDLTDAAEALLGTVATVTTESGDPSYPLTLVDAVDYLAGKLGAANPTATDERIVRVLGSYDEPFKRAALARAAMSLVAQLGAANLPKSAPLLAGIVIGGRNDGNGAAYTAALWAIGGGSDGSRPSMQPLHDLLLPLVPGERGYRSGALARALAIGARRLPRPDANALADAAVRAISQAPDSFARQGLALLLLALEPQLDAASREKALTAAKGVLAQATTPEEAVALAKLTASLLYAVDDTRLLMATTEILKYPTVAGAPTDAVLDVLESRLPPTRLPAVKHLKEMPIPSLVEWLRQQEGMAPVLAATVVRPGCGRRGRCGQHGDNRSLNRASRASGKDGTGIVRSGHARASLAPTGLWPT